MRTPRALVLVTLVGLVLGACGGQPGAAAWATSVCSALAPWRTEIDSLTGRAEQQMRAVTTPAQAKENLVRLLAGAEAASETARAKVEDAGVPDVDGGEEVAASFVSSLAAMRDAYGKAKTSVESMQVHDEAAFYAEVQAAMKTLGDEYARGSLDTTKLRSVELQEAFDEVPECQ